MSRMPSIKYREFVKVLKELGYFRVRQKGSHVIFKNEEGGRIVVPYHKGRDIPRGLLRKLISDLDLEVLEFLRLL